MSLGPRVRVAASLVRIVRVVIVMVDHVRSAKEVFRAWAEWAERIVADLHKLQLNRGSMMTTMASRS